jgi:3,4-dihydroxy 2-butanone 4-phosphate synthase/GTP cyclohydrolase II
MVRQACGELCLALTAEKCEALGLGLQTLDNTSKHGTNFTVTIDAAAGISTGTSAFDRAKTILTAIDDRCLPSDLARPGHIHPLRAREGGALVRADSSPRRSSSRSSARTAPWPACRTSSSSPGSTR